MTTPLYSPRMTPRPLAALALLLPFAGCAIDLDLRPGATNLIEALQGPTYAQAAEWALDPYDADRRRRGTLLLASAPFAGEDLYLRLFIDYLQDAESNVRSAAAQGLGAHGRPEHARLLVPLLSDPERSVRLAAASALQRLHDPFVVDALLRSLTPSREASFEVRAEVAEALGQYAERRVVRALILALDDEDPAVNNRARRSLRTLTGNDLGPSPRHWLDWNDTTPDPFLARQVYFFPAYIRPLRWFEYLPLIPQPPNEAPGTPAGLALPHS